MFAKQKKLVEGLSQATDDAPLNVHQALTAAVLCNAKLRMSSFKRRSIQAEPMKSAAVDEERSDAAI
jgi:hypothetical protein